MIGRLAAGTRLGIYEIQSVLGAGGMGEVYRARDTKLDRDVALKILPQTFTNDPERVARLRREAHLLASLNHPNIGAIYGLADAETSEFLVLELVDGEGLDRRIARGPIPVGDALSIAAQIGDALEVAHLHGIIHRDLKPANIRVRPDGTVKILDFGLAKAFTPGDAAVTASVSLTADGMIVGTAAYMSPEQARGEPTDRGSDIWAFGCVLYEMLTGKQAFDGRSVTDILAAVLTRDPDWNLVPERAQPLLRRCLARDRKERLRDIGDARFLLEGATTAGRRAAPNSLPWVFAAAATTISVVLGVMLLWREPLARQPLRLDLDLGDRAVEHATSTAVLSPDGTRLVFHASDRDGRPVLATRRLDESRPTLLIGTEGGMQPFFSPDGEWVGFFAGNKLKKVSIRGGTPVALGEADNARGASWSEDGTIVAALTNESGLSRVPAEGGAPERLTTLTKGEPTHRWPHVLPGGHAVLFTANSPTLNSYEDATIDVYTIATRERKTLWRGGYFPRYVRSDEGPGLLLYVQRGVLYGVSFDPVRLELKGAPTALLNDVAADPGSGAGHTDVSRTGTLLYRSGTGERPWTVSWVNSDSTAQPLLTKPGLYYSPRISPDGRRVALSVDDGKGADIFVYDVQRDVMRRLTFTGRLNTDPVWTPDGTHLLFRGFSDAGLGIWWIRSDGAGEQQRLLNASVGDMGSNSLSPDGRLLIYSARRGEGSWALWTVALDRRDPDRPTPGPPQPFFHGPSSDTVPAISPDGRWVAYRTGDAGRSEIYVRPLAIGAPNAKGRWQIAALGSGTGAPVWSQDGRHLFFNVGSQLMVSEYTVSGNSFVASKPRVWSGARIRTNTGFSNFDVAPDGKRAAILTDPQANPDNPRMTLILDYLADVHRRALGK